MSETELKEVGKLLRNQRESKGISIKKAAELAQTTRRTVYQIEDGTGDPSLSTVNRVAEALGVTLKVKVEPIDN